MVEHGLGVRYLMESRPLGNSILRRTARGTHAWQRGQTSQRVVRWTTS
jgi:hypothetical protein